MDRLRVCSRGNRPAQDANGVLGAVAAAASPSGLAAQPQPSCAKGEALRERYGFDTDHLVFAIAGRDLVRRGLERLLVGIGRLPEGLRDRCRVFAAGELENSFHAIAKVLEADGRGRCLERVPERRSPSATCSSICPTRRRPKAGSSTPFEPVDPCSPGRGVADSRLVEEADAGTVLAAPYRQADLDRALADLVASPQVRAGLSDNAVRFAAEPRHFLGTSAR